MDINRHLQIFAKHYDEDNHLKILYRECSELSKAIIKCLRKEDGSIDSLIEKVANIEIALYMMKYSLQISSRKINEIKKEKVEEAVNDILVSVKTFSQEDEND